MRDCWDGGRGVVDDRSVRFKGVQAGFPFQSSPFYSWLLLDKTDFNFAGCDTIGGFANVDATVKGREGEIECAG